MKLSYKVTALLIVLMLMHMSACQNKVDSPAGVSADPLQKLDDSSGQFINMFTESSKASVSSGDICTLQAAPFEENEIIYVPLTDVTTFFGGTVTPGTDGRYTIIYDQTIRGVHYEKNTTIRLGNCNATDNTKGTQFRITYMGSSAPPVFRDSIVFVPDYYFDSFLTQTYAQHDLQTGWITISNFDDGRMLAGFTLEEDFSMLDDAVKERFTTSGDPKVLIENALYETCYSDGDLALGVRTGSSLPDGKHSMIHSITLLTDVYKTPRGMRVGDPTDRCYELYGCRPNDIGQVIAGILKITEQDGIITSITFYAGS